MSASPPKADLGRTFLEVRFVPATDMMPHRRGVLRGLARSLKARVIAIVFARLHDNLREL